MSHFTYGIYCTQNVTCPSTVLTDSVSLTLQMFCYSRLERLNTQHKPLVFNTRVVTKDLTIKDKNLKAEDKEGQGLVLVMEDP